MQLFLFLYLLHTCLAEDLVEKNSNNWWVVGLVFLGAVVFFIGLTYYSNKHNEKLRKSQNGQSEQHIGDLQLNF